MSRAEVVEEVEIAEVAEVAEETKIDERVEIVRDWIPKFWSSLFNCKCDSSSWLLIASGIFERVMSCMILWCDMILDI